MSCRLFSRKREAIFSQNDNVIYELPSTHESPHETNSDAKRAKLMLVTTIVIVAEKKISYNCMFLHFVVKTTEAIKTIGMARNVRIVL